MHECNYYIKKNKYKKCGIRPPNLGLKGFHIFYFGSKLAEIGGYCFNAFVVMRILLMHRMKFKRIKRMQLQLSTLGENGELHKIEPISVKFRAKQNKNLYPKSSSWRAWNGKKLSHATVSLKSTKVSFL